MVCCAVCCAAERVNLLVFLCNFSPGSCRARFGTFLRLNLFLPKICEASLQLLIPREPGLRTLTGIDSAQRKQLVMCATLGYNALIQHVNDVAVNNGRQSMRYT